MKTSREYIIENNLVEEGRNIEDKFSLRLTRDCYLGTMRNIYLAIDQAQKDAYNQGIDDAVENVGLSYRPPHGDEYMVEMVPCGVNVMPAINLKKT